MIDRFGNDVRVGWAAHELIWINAALSLEGDERTQAFEHIASMSSRSIRAVRTKASYLSGLIEGQRAAQAFKERQKNKPGQDEMVVW